MALTSIRLPVVDERPAKQWPPLRSAPCSLPLQLQGPARCPRPLTTHHRARTHTVKASDLRPARRLILGRAGDKHVPAERHLLNIVCGESGGRRRGTVDVQRRAGGIWLRVDELEPQRRGEIFEQGKPLPQRHTPQNKAVLVDKPESAERLGERGTAPGEHILAWLAFERCDLLSQVAARDPRIRPLGTLE